MYNINILKLYYVMSSLKKLIKKIFYKNSKYSQAGQDLFALELFGDSGCYVDIGSGVPKKDSNTYLIETKHKWKGFGVEILKSYKDIWDMCPERKNKIYWEDAISFNYKKALIDNNLSNDVDFLSCDIDPQEKTFLALKKVLQDGISPKLITFETDFYREKINYSSLADTFLKNYGYSIAVTNVYSSLNKNKVFETWFVKNSLNYKTIDYSYWVKKDFLK